MIFMKVLMGFFYYIRSVALIEDLNIGEEHEFHNAQEFYSEADKMYSLVRNNDNLKCFTIIFMFFYMYKKTLIVL